MLVSIGAYQYGIAFHVGEQVSLDMVISYPQMRDLGWSVDVADHALVIQKEKFGFLTQDLFERLTCAHGIRSCQSVSLCARMSLTESNTSAFVPVALKGKSGTDLVVFEPDPAYVEKYKAYLCPGLLGVEKPAAVRILSANPDASLTTAMGTVFGQASPVQ